MDWNVEIFLLHNPIYTVSLAILFVNYYNTTTLLIKVTQLVGILALLTYSLAINLLYIDMILVSIGFIVQHIVDFIRYNKLVKREFNTIEYYIYRRDFQAFLTKTEFLKFIDIADKRVLSDHSIKLASENKSFDKLYYFAIVPKIGSILLKNNNKIFSYLREGSWIGIVEFVLNYLDNQDNKWLVDLECENNKDLITIYEFDKEKLKDFLKRSGKKFQNKVLLIWIKYLIMSVNRMNIHMSETYKLSRRIFDDGGENVDRNLALEKMISEIPAPVIKSINNEDEDVEVEEEIKFLSMPVAKKEKKSSHSPPKERKTFLTPIKE